MKKISHKHGKKVYAMKKSGEIAKQYGHNAKSPYRFAVFHNLFGTRKKEMNGTSTES